MISCLIAVFVALVLMSGFASAEPLSVPEICDSVSPGLVRIETTGGAERVGKNIAISELTGTVLTEDGLVLTSAVGFAHQPGAILVRLADGSRTSAELIGTDENRNIALLRVKLADGKKLTVPKFASKETLRIGQSIYALGRVLDEQNASVTAGVLSAVQRMRGLAVQTDASISANNYGGPLVDENGAVLAIITPLEPGMANAFGGDHLYDSGVGFAIPISDLQAILPRLETGTLHQTPKLGLLFDHPNPIFSSTKLLYVAPKSLGENAGFLKDDVILTVNGTPVKRGADVISAMAQCWQDDPITFVVRRGEQEVTLSFKLEKIEPPKSEPEADEQGDAPIKIETKPLEAPKDAEPAPETPKDAKPAPEAPKDAESAPESPQNAEPAPEAPKDTEAAPTESTSMMSVPDLVELIAMDSVLVMNRKP